MLSLYLPRGYFYLFLRTCLTTLLCSFWNGVTFKRLFAGILGLYFLWRDYVSHNLGFLEVDSIKLFHSFYRALWSDRSQDNTWTKSTDKILWGVSSPWHGVPPKYCFGFYPSETSNSQCMIGDALFLRYLLHVFCDSQDETVSATYKKGIFIMIDKARHYTTLICLHACNNCIFIEPHSSLIFNQNVVSASYLLSFPGVSFRDLSV